MSISSPPADALGLEAAVEAIAVMEVRGAAKIGRAAAATLARLARETPDTDIHATLRDAGTRLIGARPTAVSLRNAVNLTLDGLREKDPATLRAAIDARAARYVFDSERARDRIAANVAEALKEAKTVLTHCHSSLAVAALAETSRRNGSLRVFADETRPWWQGHITSKQLVEAGVDVTLIVDSAAHQVMETEHVDAVVVGADTVTADGALYNKVGTRAVALGAHHAGIPFLVAAETIKFSPYSLDGAFPQIEERSSAEVAEPGRLAAGVKVRNPVFDRTSPDLITRYMTDRGPVAPREVREHIRTWYPHTEGWL